MSSLHIIHNPIMFRANVVEKLNIFFENNTWATNLEKGIYNWTIKEATSRKVIKKWNNADFIRIYLDRLKSIYENLRDENSTNLVELVRKGEIKAQSIAFMTHYEMKPEKWEDLIRAKSVRDKAKFENRMQKNTDVFCCRKCKSKECSFYEIQLKSSDEPMNCFVSCLICGNRWKM